MSARIIALLAAALAFATLAAPATAQSVTQQTPAAQTLSRCLQTSNRLTALLLVDESQSLRNTDARNERVAGLRAALTGLSRLASTPVGGRTPEIEVMLAGFSGEVKPGEWSSVTDAELEGLLAQAGTFEQRNDGRGTDYGAALAGARQLLAQRSAGATATGGAPPCKALIWFTDGKYTVSDTSDREIERRKQDLCRTGGLMDGLAEDRVVKFTVALSSNELRGREGAFLTGLTTGSGHCGSALSEQTGEFLVVGNSARLLFAFSSLFLSQSTPIPSQACPKVSCEIGRTEFTTVPGLSSFLIDASTAADGVLIELQPPHGPPTRLAHGGPTRITVGGTPITQRWVSGRAVEIQGDLAAGGEAARGRWTFTLIDPQGRTGLEPEYTLHVFADLQPVIAQRRELVVGEPTKVAVSLTDSEGKSLTGGELVDATTLSATLTDPSTGKTMPVTLTAEGPGRAIADVTVPATSSASSAFLDVEAAFALPDVINIVPQRRSFRFVTKLPPDEGLPEVSPTELRMPSIDGKGSTSSTLTLAASSAAAGCVWLSLEGLSGPEDAGKITPTVKPDATSRTRCVRLAKGQQRRLELTLSPEHQATGSVRGTVRMRLSSEIAKAERAKDIPVSFEQLKTPSPRTWVLFVTLLVTGTLLPLGWLHALNWRGARFTRGEHALKVLQQDITIRPHQRVEGQDGAALNANYLDAEPIQPTANGRELDVGGVHCRAVASGTWLGLFTGPHGVATASAGGEVVAGSVQPTVRPRADGTAYDVPLALPGTWLFAPTRLTFPQRPDGFDPDTPPPPPTQIDGVLSMVMAADRGAHQGEELAANATLVLREHEWTRPPEPDTEAEREHDWPDGGDHEREERRSRPRPRLPRRKRTDETDQWPVQDAGSHDEPPDPSRRLPSF